MLEIPFGVPYYGLDLRERVKTGLILQFFQEAAASHADRIKSGVEDLQKNNTTWVLRRYRIRIHSYPQRGTLTVRTWYEAHRNLMSVRVFELVDEQGQKHADAWSSWIVVDLAKGRPQRLDRVLPPEYFESMEPTGEFLDEPLAALDPGSYDYEKDFSVRWSELDINRHTNHTVYFEWALESVPEEIWMTHVPMGLDAEYLSSVQRTDVTVGTRLLNEAPPTYAHSIRTNDGTEAARVNTVWERAPVL